MSIRLVQGMWRNFRVSLFAVVALLLTGCANLSTIERQTHIPNDGLAIHLDAAQRVVLSDKNGFACAEPSPDALQAFAAAIGASVGDPVAKATSLSAAMNTSAASIGLRTQSITLMRETLYRICESARNRSLSPPDVAQLLQRAQDLTLAVLAIEQLTGAVIARQVALTQSSNATASANVANTQAALDSAKKNEQIAKDALAAAQTEEQRQADILKKNDSDLAAAQKKTPPVQSDIDKLIAQQKEQSDKVQKSKDETKVANDGYMNAQKAAQAILANFNAALASAQAVANGGSNFVSQTDHKNIDKETVQFIATATQKIVDSALTKGRLTDACITLMNQTTIKRDDGQSEGLVALRDGLCTQVLETTLRVYEATLLRELQQPVPPAPLVSPPPARPTTTSVPRVLQPYPPAASMPRFPQMAEMPRPPAPAAPAPPPPPAAARKPQ